MDLDTNWCPVCDRLIAPERIRLPPSESEPTTTPTADVATKPKSGTARPGYARRLTGNPSRTSSKSSVATHKAPGLNLLTTQASSSTSSAKSRTVISQAPSALYCSEACRVKDQLSSERFQLSLETMYSGPSSTSTLSSPLFVSGSESDADLDLLTNESYFAQLRIHGRAQRQPGGATPDTDSWADRRLSAGATTATTSSSEDLPTASSPAATQPPSATSSNGRSPILSQQHGRSKSVSDGNAALYAAYPLTFHRTRSGKGSARSRKNSYSSLCDASIESTHEQPKGSGSTPKDIQAQTIDVTPTQSLYGTDVVSAQGLLVRPALLRAKTERSVMSPLSPISTASDSAPRLYSPQYPSSLPASKFGFTPMSTPASPTGSRNPSRHPSKGDLSQLRRRSEILSQEALSEANRTKSCDQISTQRAPFMPMYPTVMTTPSTRTVRKWVMERGADGVERLVEKEVVEECTEERKRLFHFSTGFR